MQLQRYSDGPSFLEAAADYLYHDEVINGVLIGVADRTHEHTAAGYTPYLATITQSGQFHLVAVMTPPHRLLLNAESVHQSEALGALVEDLRGDRRTVPGVTGPVQVAEAFASSWRQAETFAVERSMEMMVFELRNVMQPEAVSGEPRLAEDSDLDLLSEWIDSFNREVRQNPRPDRNELRRSVVRRIERQELLLWEDGGRPVSLAGRSRPSPRGAAIDIVRTPAEFRRQGYASACVAELSQRILDEGKQFVTLFTDVANPTPNHIYQQIGYQPRGEFVQLDFV